MSTRRRAWLTLLAALLLGSSALCEADTTLNQGLISAAIFRKMRAVQNMIRGGQYSEAVTQLNYLQGVTTSTYEAAVVRELSADLNIARGDYPAALAALQPVVQQNILPPGEQRDAQLALAKLDVAAGQYPAGAELMRSWLLTSQDNQPADALITAAQAYAQLGQCHVAAPYAKRAIDVTSDPPIEWYQLLISCLYDGHDYSGAADALQGLLARFPDQTQYWLQLGESYTQAGDVSRALAVYTLMYRQGQLQNAQDYLNFVSLYMQNGEPFQAAQLLQQSLQAGTIPATEANYTLLASAWVEAKEREKAVAALGEAVKVAQSGEPFLTQAQLYAAHHEWFSVIDTTRKALAKGALKHPGHAWLLQGVALLENRQYDDAATALREAAKYDDTRSQAETWLRYLNVRSAG
jgi:tetratricopeptide (TPR) repeat protein